MRFATTIATLLTVGLAAAHSRRATCPAQNILDACLATEKPQLAGCTANDWSCLCEQSNNVLTCYNNCPGDPGQFGAQQTMTSYCNAAKAYSSSSSSSSSSSGTAASTAASTASLIATTRAVSSATSTASDSEATQTGLKNLNDVSSSSTTSESAATATSSHSAAAPGTKMLVQGGLVAAWALGLGMAL